LTIPTRSEADVDEIGGFQTGRCQRRGGFRGSKAVTPTKKAEFISLRRAAATTAAGRFGCIEPTNKDEGRLTLLFESPSREILDMPDNICLRPKTNLLFICEDSDYVGEGGTRDNYMRILTPDGRIADFAKNISPNFTNERICRLEFMELAVEKYKVETNRIICRSAQEVEFLKPLTRRLARDAQRSDRLRQNAFRRTYGVANAAPADYGRLSRRFVGDRFGRAISARRRRNRLARRTADESRRSGAICYLDEVVEAAKIRSSSFTR
jgi:hypothetical protein